MKATRFIGTGFLALGIPLVMSGVAMADVEFVAADSKATLISNNTIAIVTASVVCTVGDTLSVSAVVQQLHGQTSIVGSGFVEDLDCIGVPQSVAVPVQVMSPPNDTYKKGPAQLILLASTANENNTNFDSQTITAKVNLK